MPLLASEPARGQQRRHAIHVQAPAGTQVHQRHTADQRGREVLVRAAGDPVVRCRGGQPLRRAADHRHRCRAQPEEQDAHRDHHAGPADRGLRLRPSRQHVPLPDRASRWRAWSPTRPRSRWGSTPTTGRRSAPGRSPPTSSIAEPHRPEPQQVLLEPRGPQLRRRSTGAWASTTRWRCCGSRADRTT